MADRLTEAQSGPVERHIQNSMPSDGFDCIYLFENGKEVGCINGPQDDPEVQRRAADWVASAVKRHPILNNETEMPAGGYPALAGATVSQESQVTGPAGSPTTFSLAEALAIVREYGPLGYPNVLQLLALDQARHIIRSSAMDAMQRFIAGRRALQSGGTE